MVRFHHPPSSDAIKSQSLVITVCKWCCLWLTRKVTLTFTCYNTTCVNTAFYSCFRIFLRCWIKWICLQLFIHLFIYFYWPRHAACGILVPQSGIEPTPPAVNVQSLSHWTTREVPESAFRTLFLYSSNDFHKPVKLDCTMIKNYSLLFPRKEWYFPTPTVSRLPHNLL